MTAHSPSLAAFAPQAALSAEALVSGPCALPQAPLAMPAQVIEAEHGLLRRVLGGLMPFRPAAPSAGAGL